MKKHRYPTRGREIVIAGAMGPQQEVQQQEVVQQTQEVREPVEDADTLRSHSYARAIDLLCEGEIEGLVDRAGNVLRTPAEFGRGIFIDETPLQNADGSFNFKGVKVGMTWGTQDQEALYGFGTPGEVIYSGKEITKAIPVVVGITNSHAQRIEVAIRVPALLSQEKKTGDIHGNSVVVGVLAALNGSEVFQEIGGAWINGKASQPYVRTIGCTLPRSSPSSVDDQWAIKVIRTTPPAKDLSEQKSTFLDYVSVWTRNTFRYPNSVIVGVEIDAKGLSSVPARAYRIRGLRVQVPSNYDPETRLYNRKLDGTLNTVPLVFPNPHPTGRPKVFKHTLANPVPGATPPTYTFTLTNAPTANLTVDFPIEIPWTGLWWTAWTDNPAWCFHDLCIATRYGLGDYLAADDDGTAIGTLDKWTLYTIGRYCDVMIDDGFGRLEPRFACNLVMQAREEAFKVMQDMASIFRGMLYWQTGQIVAVQDRPREPVAVFTNANVVEGAFNYAGTARKARHTSVVVRYNDRTDFYRPKFEFVSSATGFLKYGFREVQIAAFGCSSRGQAHRLGRWTLLSELNQTETVAFKTGLEGAYLRPGDVFEVLDNHRAGKMHGGRLLAIAADGLSVRLDRGVPIPAGAVTVTIARPQGFNEPAEITSSAQAGAIRTPQTVVLTITNPANVTSTGAPGLGIGVVQGSQQVTAEALVDLTGTLPGDELVVQGESYVIRDVLAPAGGDPWRLVLEQPFKGTTDPGAAFAIAARRLTFAAAVEGLEVGAVWMIETPTLSAQRFQVLNVEEIEAGVYGVSGLEYATEKFDATENALDLEAEEITELPIDVGIVPAPQNVVAGRASVITADGVKLQLTVSWEQAPDDGIDAYLVEYRRLPDQWSTIEQTAATSSAIDYTVPGDYEFRVTAIGSTGARSDSIIASFSVDSENPIETVGIEGLELQGQGNDTNFTGRDAKFAWRLRNPNTAIEPGQEDDEGGQGGFTDPYFEKFEVSIWDEALDLLVFRDDTQNPWYIFSHEKNAETPLGPRAQFRFEVRALDKFGNSSAPAKLVVQNPPPSPPVNVGVIAAFRFVSIAWQRPPELDVASFEIWESASANFGEAVLIATTTGNDFVRAGLEVDTHRWYWVIAVDTFGSKSTRSPIDGIGVVTGQIGVQDLDIFPLEISQMFLEVIILKGDAWANNTPGAGSIAWNAHKVFFRGIEHAIPAGNTALQYVYWLGPVIDGDGTVLTPGETFYRVSALHPGDAGLLGTRGFIIATNAEGAGFYSLAWRGFANAVIGSAWIKKAAITSAHVESLEAGKITGDEVTGQEIVLADKLGDDGEVISRAIIRSKNYIANVAGWIIRSDGFAEFGTLSLRENLAFGSGYYNPAFETRLFQARPDIACPILSYNAGWANVATSGSPHRQTLHCSDGVTRTRQMLFYYGQLIVAPFNVDKTVPSPLISPLFFGVDRGDYIFHAGQPDELTYLARPRRLARDGDNVFTIEATARCWWGFSVWYQIADFPVWMDGLLRESMGNRYGPNAAPANVGAPWEFACAVRDGTNTAGYQILSNAQRVKINVPSDKVILFAIGPIGGTGTRDATAGSSRMYNGFLRVTAENVGNILITEDPSEVDGEEDI